MNDYLYTNDIFVVSPVAKRVYLEPGKSYDAYVKITNPAIAEHTLHYKVSAVPYNVFGEDYTADFNTQSEYSKIADWITLESNEGYVEPNETVTVKYKINVPENAPGGGQYCAVAVQSVKDEASSSENGVAVNDVLEITSILYAQVNGDIKREGSILENNLPVISFVNPINTSMMLKNDGNVHQDAQITIKAQSALTGRVIMLDGGNEENIDEEDESTMGYDKFSEVIMPETTRFVNHKVEGLPSLGFYKLTQEVEFDGQTNVNEQVILMCPIWFACLVAVALSAVIALLVRKKKNRK